MATRPSHGRTPSTNLIGGGGPRSLDGKIAIVTGASRGIGAAICQNLASKGCTLIMNYTSDSSAQQTEELAKHLQATQSIQTLTVQSDMGSETGPAHLVTTAKNHFSHPKTGKFQIDILINNAGVSGNLAIADTDVTQFAKQYNINVRGPLLLLQAAIPYLPHDRSGRIVNLSSVSASMGFKQQSIYGGTKAALEGMTRVWANELAERATVNAVNPGPVKTEMYASNGPDFAARVRPYLETTPLAKARAEYDGEEDTKEYEKVGGRPAYDYEIAGVVGMLVTQESGWCTGSVICANGGMRYSP